MNSQWAVNKTLSALTVCILAVLLSVTAHAERGNWYITPSVVHTDDDGDRNIDDSIGGGQITLGRTITRNLSFEGLLGYSNIPSTRGGAPAQKHLEAGVNLLLFMKRDSAFSPYFLAGLGYLGTEYENGGEENRPTGSFGLGFKWDLSRSVTFKAEHRARVAYESANNLIDRISTLGFQVSFGEKKPRFIDTDADGIADHFDWCPGTLSGAEVNEKGCEPDSDGDSVVNNVDACPNTPVGVLVDALGCPPDNDGDGVADHWDRCPNTVAGAVINADGCEWDNDGDKVVDRLDRCPNTTGGVRIDVNGCEIRDVIKLPGINFATNSDRLLPGTEQVLADAAATLRKYPDLVVEVAGHTDSDGSAVNNQGLSERRASTVRNFMINYGAPAANLSVHGYGEARPIADNVTAHGKATNRRVELRILSRGVVSVQ